MTHCTKMHCTANSARGQFEERKAVDPRAAGLIPLFVTIVLSKTFAYWHVHLQFATNNQNH